ncbi:MAG: hypothetical protein HY286_08150 [Planctomycetes bacterium]|nr:hypothetical protein [Planctomycetota bacterium]
MNIKRLLLGITLLAVLIACQAPSPSDKGRYQNITRQGYAPVEEKSPLVALLLNILPGVGDIYNSEWGAFALDLLLWPISPIWAVPQGAITASNINKSATVAYYTVGEGRRFDVKPDEPDYIPKLPVKKVEN